MPRPRSDIAARVQHAARERFLIEGVDGASLRAIAADAGTSVGMIYYYFPTKDDLFLAVVEEVYVALLEELETALGRTVPVVERLRRLYARLGALTGEERKVVRLVVREGIASPVRLKRLIARFKRGHVPLLLDLARDGLATGVFRRELPPALLLAAIGSLGGPAQILLGLLEQHLPSRQAGPRGFDRAGALVDLLLTGAGNRSATRRRKRK